MDTEAINNWPTFAKISCKVGRGRQPYRGALVSRDKILPVLVNFRWILAKPETRNNPNLVRNRIMSSLHFCHPILPLHLPEIRTRPKVLSRDLFQRPIPGKCRRISGKVEIYSYDTYEGRPTRMVVRNLHWFTIHRLLESYFERGSEKCFQHLDKSIDASALWSVFVNENTPQIQEARMLMKMVYGDHL